jgi:hypothetical protein
MKNIIMGSVLAIAAVTSLSANAADHLSAVGLATDDGSLVTSALAFVKVPLRRSVRQTYSWTVIDSSSTLYVVSAASAKGKRIFAGSTAGGAVGASGYGLRGQPCTAGEVSIAATTAETAAAGLVLGLNQS